jgi:MFS family permease
VPEPRERVPAHTTRLGALASAPFARLLSGQVVSQVGTQMSNTAGAWVLYRLTHSVLALGLQGLCFSAPIAVLPLLTGILADRFSRLTLVRATLAAEAAQAFALAAITVAGDLRPWMLYLAAAADACRLAVNIPAQSALVPNVVPAEMLLSAMALSTSTWSSAALVGPALAGALLTVTGPGLIFAINGACTLVALGAVGSLRSTAQAQPVEGNGFAQLTGGISYLRSHRPVLWLEGVLLIAMTGALGVETLLPVFAAGTWHTGPAGYGLLRMAPGIAAVLAGVGLSMFPAVGRGAVTIGIAFAGASAGMAAFAAGPSFALALFLLASASLCLAATQVIAGTMVQQAIPDALRGRISALGSAGQNGLAGLAAAATSAVAAAVGPGRAVTALAATIASAGILLALLIARYPYRTENQPSERKPPDWIPDDRINGRGK